MTGTLLSVPAAAASLVQAAPSYADPGSGTSGASGQRSSATTSAVRAASPSTVVTVRYGSKGSYVKTVQQRLGGLAVDGVFGTRTLAKVKTFQRSHHLVADGIVGSLTWKALGGFPGSKPPPTTTPPPKTTPPPSCKVTVLRYGATGSYVSSAQSKLGGISADGVFGAATLSRVKSFQSSKGLAADGIIGPLTWTALGGFPCGTDPTPTPPPPPSNNQGVSEVVSIAQKYYGVPYVWGGSTPSQGFDCSGLTSYVYKQAGMYIPRTASQQQAYVKRTTSPQPGDLVFFGSPATHSAIYAGGNMMISADHPGTVVKKERMWTTPTNYGTLR
ncbi:peptidoglycan-binding protein [Flexivirga alba]|uniref:Peptidoglycan-binding protein n=1 Tax=Flexivirga alba TaxID=702742 RepID=A0ABW2AI27_9MICO